MSSLLGCGSVHGGGDPGQGRKQVVCVFLCADTHPGLDHPRFTGYKEILGNMRHVSTVVNYGEKLTHWCFHPKGFQKASTHSHNRCKPTEAH